MSLLWLSFEADQKLSDAEARRMVQDAGISIKDCHNGPNCPSLQDVNLATIEGIIALKKTSGCPITITHGTEIDDKSVSQYAHWNGYKLDIMSNSCITNHIRRNFTYMGPRQGDNAPQFKSPAGNIYADEGEHWDITFF
jgi:hypothetical protein